MILEDRFSATPKKQQNQALGPETSEYHTKLSFTSDVILTKCPYLSTSPTSHNRSQNLALRLAPRINSNRQ